MSLDELADRTAPTRLYRECTVHYILRTLDDRKAATLDRVLSNPNVLNSEIRDELADLGFAVSLGVLAKHRATPRRRCACPR